MGKHAFPPLPTRPQLVLAVYPALFSFLIVLQVCLLGPKFLETNDGDLIEAVTDVDFGLQFKGDLASSMTYSALS